MNSKKCVGCGSFLQDKDKKGLGYTPDINKDYCMRCFRLIHYHDLSKEIAISSRDILDSLNKKRSGLCLFFCDILNFNEESINYYKEIKMPKMFVISKVDLLPNSIKYDSLVSWVKNILGVQEDVFLVSSKRGCGVSRLHELIENVNTPVYFLGMTNAGKSSFLNKCYSLSETLTVSEMPNTTIDFIKIFKDRELYDSAGFPYHFSYQHDLLKNIFPIKKICEKNMPLKENASIILNDLFRLEVFMDTNITCYFPSSVILKKRYLNNSVLKSSNYIDLVIPKMSNLFFKGIGFCYFKNETKIRLYNISEDMISIYPSFFGGVK